MHNSAQILNTLLLVIILFLTPPTVAALLDHSTYSIKERHEVPHGWAPLRRASPQHKIQLQLGLKQNRFSELEKLLQKGKPRLHRTVVANCHAFRSDLAVHLVSNPSHTSYGQYLTGDEVNALVAPSEKTLSLVQKWLQQHEIPSKEIQYSPASDYITLNLQIGVAENMLQAEYVEFWNEETENCVIRAPEWSLPTHLHDHIDFIQPTSSFFYASIRKRDCLTKSGGSITERNFERDEYQGLNQVAEPFSDEGFSKNLDLGNFPGSLTLHQACNASAVTPLCIRFLYGTLGYQPKVADRNSMAIVNYGGEFNNRSDIDLFLGRYRPEAARARAAFNFKTEVIAGATNQQSPATNEQLKKKIGREGNQDVQTLLGIAFPTALIAYSTGGTAPEFKPDEYTPTNTNEPFLTWLHHVLAQKDLPHVIVTSYGDIEQTVPYSYAKRVCEGFAQLGARGVSVIFGAGDSGVGKPGYCYSNDGSSTYEFLTSFPASCPYGTSVGATRDIEPEEIVAYNDRNGFVSGGGFSKYFPRPAYQNVHGVVDEYLYHLGNETYAGLYNGAGRAYPDVAAHGYRRAMVWNGQKYLVDGTSVSAPTFGAIIALVNDAIIADGMPRLGFLNPWLYLKGFEGFTDIISGNNRGCDTGGFQAEKGWDPASGFGTPWFPRLKQLALERRFRYQRPWYWPAESD